MAKQFFVLIIFAFLSPLHGMDRGLYPHDYQGKSHNDEQLINWDKIKLAYKRMCETKNEFRNPYAALEELDDLLVGNKPLVIKG